ncbi:MAG: hypothetical protein E8D45_09015, partial [Nitrospira sp.]
MLKDFLRKVLLPIRRLAGKFILPPGGTYTYIGRHGCIHAASSFITWNQIEGDYLEFGVWEGASFIAAYHAVRDQRRRHLTYGYDTADYRRWKDNPPRFMAFDSFAGLPGGAGERHVDYHRGAYQCPEDRFKVNLKNQGVDLSAVLTVPGFYDKTLNADTKAKLGLRKAAMVMIDCDLYESTMPVLDFLTDLVGQGTIIIFDDWFRFRGSPEHGEQRACREWLAK